MTCKPNAHIDPRKFYDTEDLKEEDEHNVCRFFGCGKMLSVHESRFGEYCMNHGPKEKLVYIIDKYIYK